MVENCLLLLDCTAFAIPAVFSSVLQVAALRGWCNFIGETRIWNTFRSSAFSLMIMGKKEEVHRSSITTNIIYVGASIKTKLRMWSWTSAAVKCRPVYPSYLLYNQYSVIMSVWFMTFCYYALATVTRKCQRQSLWQSVIFSRYLCRTIKLLYYLWRKPLLSKAAVLRSYVVVTATSEYQGGRWRSNLQICFCSAEI